MQSKQIQPDMPVVCTLRWSVCGVDYMEDEDMIKLKRDDEGKHHYLPLSWVTSVKNGKVKIDRPSEEAMQEWSETLTM